MLPTLAPRACGVARAIASAGHARGVSPDLLAAAARVRARLI